jgi:DNA repair exonuclease SbcCD ATPase subunit
MSHKFNGITIDNFRGIQHLEIPIDGRNLVIVGENGSGKSSIVDALEYCFTGRIAKLQGRSDVDAENSIPYFGKTPTAIKVICRGVTNQPIVTTHPNKKLDVPPPLRNFFNLAASRPFILRRSQLLKFIDARPSERYEQISQLIGLSELDRADTAWRKARDKAIKEDESLQIEYDGELSALSGLLGEDVATVPELIKAINKQLAQYNLAPLSLRYELGERKTALLNAMALTPEARERQERIQRISRNLQSVRESVRELGQMEKKRQERLAEFLHMSHWLEEASMEHLLTSAKRFIEDHPSLSHCPICETPVEAGKDLLNRLSERLTSLQSLTEARQNLSAATDEIKTQLIVIQERLQPLARGLIQTNELASSLDSKDLPAIRTFLDEFLAKIELWVKALRADRDPELSLDYLRAQYQQLNAFTASVEAAVRQQALTTDQEEQLALIDKLPRLDEHWQALERLTPKLRRAQMIREQVELVYDELIAARQRGLKRLREELESDFQHLYNQLHPGEGYGSITIPVHADRRSSVGLSAQFHDQKKAHPLNYFSEGHLDSLGLCIFLAFIKRFNGELKLLVLDDILTTVDAGHRLRVARLLAREFSEYQIIITTHDQLWARQLERALPHAKLIGLTEWSPTIGADSLILVNDWDYCLQQARQGRCLDAVSGAGRNLEKFLGQMRYNLRLPVPAQPNDAYTIGDLSGPFFGWLNQHRPQRPDRPDFMQELQLLRTEFDEIWRLRNWAGAHFNDWAATLSTTEATAFVRTMRQLEEAFTCPACGHLVVYNNTIRALICPNCPPQPPARVNWVYQADWRERTEMVLQKDKPQLRQNAIPLVQKSWHEFLQDMRRRLQLAVPATADEQYGLGDLHDPFFDWLGAHPLPTVANWAQFVSHARQQLTRFWQNGHWQDVSLDEVGNLITAVANVTHRFHCPDCRTLLAYDYEQEKYLCLNCAAAAEPAPAGAYWYVA